MQVITVSNNSINIPFLMLQDYKMYNRNGALLFFMALLGLYTALPPDYH